MARRGPSDSESEESKSNEANSEEEEEEETDSRSGNHEEKEMPDYERQRLERMAANRARMEALGLHTMASSLMSPAVKRPGHSDKSAQRKGKRKSVDDEDYEPDQDEGTSDDADDLDQVQDVDEDFVARRSSSKPQRNKNNKGSTSRKGVARQKKSSKVANIVNEDEELMQAITLSLKDSLVARDKKADTAMHGTNGKPKNQKFSSRVKMTEDDLIMYFFQFDERGSGVITRKDLQRMATAHDFTWSDKELDDMMDCFDGDGDGKLNLADFREVVNRCNMLRE